MTAASSAEAHFARFADSDVVGVLVGSANGRVVKINDRALELWAYTREEVLSGSVSWHGFTPPEWHAVDALLSPSGLGALCEQELIRKDGQRVRTLVGGVRVERDDGLALLTMVDLTERSDAHTMRERLREAQATEERFRALLDAAPDAMVIVDGTGVITLVNGQAEALFGYTPAELVGQAIELLMPERFRGEHPAHRDRYFREHRVRPMGAKLELYGRRKDGAQFPIEVSLSPLQTEAGLLVCSAIRDITERKAADQQRARLAALVESSDDAIIGKSLDGIVTS